MKLGYSSYGSMDIF